MIWGFILTALYWLSAVVGLQWAVVPDAGTAIWPASGIAFAALLLGGVKLWPAIFAGRLLAAFTVGSPQPLWADVVIAAGTALGAALPAWRIRRRGGFDPRLGNLRDMGWMIVGGAVLGPLISGSIGIGALWASGTPTALLPGALTAWCVGYAVGVLSITPVILCWARPEQWRQSARTWAHLGLCLITTAAGAYLAFLAPAVGLRPWHLFPALVWAALAFSVPGASLALLVTAGLATWSVVAGVWPVNEILATSQGRLLMAQQYIATVTVTILLLASVADERRGAERLARSEQRLRAETEALETLNVTGSSIAAELDLDALVQRVTDAGVALSGAKFGAFFYRLANEGGETFMLYTLSGAPREAFENFGHPRSTPIFEPTFSGRETVRSDDITIDPRYGLNPPHRGMPEGHLPVRSYLGVPVKSRSGEVLGGLIFGHPEPGVFNERSERLAAGLAAQAAISLDNARLFQAAQREIVERKRGEEHQQLLINELNHRVKNTLATVQSVAAQTLRSAVGPEAAKEAFTSRLVALSRAHDVLTGERWEGADLRDIIAGAVSAFEAGGPSPFTIAGPNVRLEPKAALAIAMAIHELGTNAAKYGSLSVPGGRVEICWTVRPEPPGDRLSLTWREENGPPVEPPKSRGFGSRLIERGLSMELGGRASIAFERSGVLCAIEARLPSTPPAASPLVGVGAV